MSISKYFRLCLGALLSFPPGRNWFAGIRLACKRLNYNIPVKRRAFLGFLLGTLLTLIIGCGTEKGEPSEGENDEEQTNNVDQPLQGAALDRLKEAKYYRQLEAGKVKCELCFRKCIIADGKTGFCLARTNSGGKLYTLTYGKPVAVYIDPLEKAPFLHVLPGSDALSLGTASCNLRCKNCINWQFTFKAPEEVEAVYMSPEDVVRTAISRKIDALCFTYNEPTVQYEYIYDIANLAKEEGIRVTLHSNGMISPEPLEELLPLIDAVVIDLKSFNTRLYRDLTGGELETVLQTIKQIRERTWLEIVCLLIPTLSDNLDEIGEMCNWISENLGQEVPVHFSRFFPSAKLTQLPPTPVSVLEQACNLAAKEGLAYAYINNVPGHERTNTYCPRCAEKIINRRGLFIQENNIIRGTCAFCGHEIAGVWK